MGEFAAALAHEINQPLTAIANYARLARSVAEKTPADTATVAEASERPIAQVERAAEVVRRLRNFIRLGRSEAVAVAVRAADRAGAAALPRRSSTGTASSCRSTSPAICRRSCRHPADRAGHHQPGAQRRRGAHRRRPLRRQDVHRAEREDGLVSICVRDNGPGLRPGSDRARRRAVHHHQARRIGARPFALPLDRRGAWRPALDRRRPDRRQGLLHACALPERSPMPLTPLR